MMETGWGATTLPNKPEEYSSSTEREARSIALEKAYVHDVYSQIASHFSDSRYRAWPKVKQFLLELEPGSIVCDVGCGNGKYLEVNPSIYKIGIDRCSNLTGAAREKNREVLISDNLNIPFRDDCFDAVISIAVIHHFATTERRVAALKELARVLRIGGRLMVSVWAMEQRHRRFESQDVLVPWSRPLQSSSDDKTSSIERDLNSTTTTTSEDADDAATHYHAYTQTSDSDHSYPSGCSFGGRKRGRNRHRGGRSIDPACPSSSQSSSDLSSPNESCYTFVRKALQKLAGTRRHRGGRRPWFLQGLDIPLDEQDGDGHHLHFASLEEDCPLDADFAGMDEGEEAFDPNSHYPHPDSELNADFMPIELRKLEASDYYTELFAQVETDPKPVVLYPRRRTLETPKSSATPTSRIEGQIASQPKSKSLSDLFGLLPGGILRSRRSTEDHDHPLRASRRNSQSSAAAAAADLHFKLQLAEASSPWHLSSSSLSRRSYSPQLDQDYFEPSSNTAHKSVQTESALSSCESLATSSAPEECDETTSSTSANRLRPLLVKQKAAITSPSSLGECGDDLHNNPSPSAISPPPVDHDSSLCWGDMKRSVRDLPELRRRPSLSSSNTLQVPSTTSPRPGGILGLSSSFWKQSSLNEELMQADRLKEKAALKQAVQKQVSLNEELIYKQRRESGSGGSNRWETMKEAILNSPNSVKCLQILRNGISNSISSAFRGGSGEASPNGVGNGTPAPPTAPGGESSSNSSDLGSQASLSPTGGSGTHSYPRSSAQQPPSASSSIRNGIVRMLQNWKQTEGSPTEGGFQSGPGSGQPLPPIGRGLFPPFFLRRSSAGSLNSDHCPHPGNKVLSPPPHGHLVKRRPSENELLPGGGSSGSGSSGSSNGGNKLLPGVRHIRKLSREEGSDSSKDSSFQSDTSIDSEDSFASVIFIPMNTKIGPGPGDQETCFSFNPETRANSTDSDRSPKSPASRLSPPNHSTFGSNLPKSPSPLASEPPGRRKSPEVSPTKGSNVLRASPYYSSTARESPKFVFDECATTLLTPGTVPPPSGDEISLLVTLDPPPSVSPLPPLVEESSPMLTLPAQAPKRRSKSPVEKIQVVRKPGVVPEGSKMSPRQLVRRSLPKSLAIELFNPETDDADTSEASSSSSPNSVSSVVSVVNEEVDPVPVEKPVTPTPTPEPSADSSTPEPGSTLPSTCAIHPKKPTEPILDPPPPPERLDTRLECPLPTPTPPPLMSSTSLESAAGARRRLTLAKLGSTSEWLISLPSYPECSSSSSVSGGSTGSSNGTPHHYPGPGPLLKRSSLERRSDRVLAHHHSGSGSGGEKLLLGDLKKYQGKGPDAKWPSSMMEDSPPNSATPTNVSVSQPFEKISSLEPDPVSATAAAAAELNAKLLEEMEEGDSLFDSLENLSTSRQHPSRNPSLDSSLRLSSTCSCSLRGGESFESWSSAKSSLTNSSSNHPPLPPVPVAVVAPLPPLALVAVQPLPKSSANAATVGRNSGATGGLRTRRGHQSKGGDGDGDGFNSSTPLTYHRYYHVFREGELDKLIEKYVQNLHIISSYYDHANWCIIAEKVQVWTI